MGPFLAPSAFGQGAKNEVTVEGQRVWVDFDVTSGDQLGMVIHINLTYRQTVIDRGKIVLSFEFENGSPVYSDTPRYASPNGQLTVYRTAAINIFNAKFSKTKDKQVFLPYREISVGAGSHNLRIKMDLVIENTDPIHVTYYNFSFTK